MYPAYTQLVAKWSSPSIGDQRATGCHPFSVLLYLVDLHRQGVVAAYISDFSVDVLTLFP